MDESEISDFLQDVHIGEYVVLDCSFRSLFGKPRHERLAGYIDTLTPVTVHLSKTDPLLHPKERKFGPGGIYYRAIDAYAKIPLKDIPLVSEQS
jgi:hypothetical protein